MSWQDMVMTGGQAIFVVLLTWVSIDKHTRINRWSAWMNSIIIGEFAHVFWTLGMYGSSVTEMLCSVLWAWIAVNRSTKA